MLIYSTSLLLQTCRSCRRVRPRSDTWLARVSAAKRGRLKDPPYVSRVNVFIDVSSKKIIDDVNLPLAWRHQIIYPIAERGRGGGDASYHCEFEVSDRGAIRTQKYV